MLSPHARQSLLVTACESSAKHEEISNQRTYLHVGHVDGFETWHGTGDHELIVGVRTCVQVLGVQLGAGDELAADVVPALVPELQLGGQNVVASFDAWAGTNYERQAESETNLQGELARH